MKHFNINFFEFSFLVEACIPPQPIARAMFWAKVINEHYQVLSPSERKQLFNWVTENSRFSNENEDCRLFFARFNPKNQYRVEYEYQGKKQSTECFIYNGKYHVSGLRHIADKYIINAEKINPQ